MGVSGLDPGIPKDAGAAGRRPGGQAKESLPKAAARDLRPPSRPGAPGLALPRGPRCDPEALRKRFRSGRRQDGGGHAGEAGGRGANAAVGGAGARAAGTGWPGRRPRRPRPWRAQKEAAAVGGGLLPARGSHRPGRAERPRARGSCHRLGFGAAGALLGLFPCGRLQSLHSESATVPQSPRGDAEAPDSVPALGV